MFDGGTILLATLGAGAAALALRAIWTTSSNLKEDLFPMFGLTDTTALVNAMARVKAEEAQRQADSRVQRTLTLADKLPDLDLMFDIGRAIGDLPYVPETGDHPLKFTGPHGYEHAPSLPMNQSAIRRSTANFHEYASGVIKHFREHVLYHETLDKMVKERIAADKVKAASPITDQA